LGKGKRWQSQGPPKIHIDALIQEDQRSVDLPGYVLGARKKKIPHEAKEAKQSNKTEGGEGW